jgi:hypothetical protein
MGAFILSLDVATFLLFTLLEASVDDNYVKEAKFCPKCGSTNVFYASGSHPLWSIEDRRNVVIVEH